MQLSELKDCILTNNLPDGLIIIVNKDNKFLSKQYIDYIIKNNEVKINYINSLFDIAGSSIGLVLDEVDHINILKTDIFKDCVQDYSAIKNTIVICDSVDKSISTAVSDFIIKLPKFEEWQIKDYMHVICPGLDESDINWLYTVASADVNKITNELDKIKLFPEAKQTNVLTELHYEAGTDLYKLDSWTIFAGIINNNKALVLDALQHRNCIDLTGFFLITSLLNKFKQILFLKFNSGLSLENIGISSGAAWHVKNDFKDLPEEVILKAIDFLSYLDQQVKTGELDFAGDDTRLVDYVLCKIFEILR